MSAKITHGHTCGGPSRTYRIWNGIMNRCRGPYGYYFVRGIGICKRWHKFAAFLKDVGEIPDGYSLDRINNKCGYSPSNCRLATPKQQARNRCNNLMITIDGSTKTSAEWQEQYNLPPNTLANRLNAGRTGRDLIAPSGAFRERMISFRGRTQCLLHWARELGVHPVTIAKRLGQYGWTKERALTTYGDSRKRQR
jgi:hypothetical protein